MAETIASRADGRDPSGLRGPTLAGRAPAAPVDPSVRAALVLALFDAHRRGLYGFALAAVRDAALAEDLVQETFLRLVRELDAGHRPANPPAWLFRVCANLVTSDARRRGVVAHLGSPVAPFDAAVSAEDETMLRADWQALQRGLRALPTEARRAVLLAAEGRRGREVADAIGHTESATRTILFRARRTLRASLADEVGGPTAMRRARGGAAVARAAQPKSSATAASKASL
ncbi:MAG: RNA polymerase sigma factor [Candidatus Limnocylindrales bacterium]